MRNNTPPASSPHIAIHSNRIALVLGCIALGLAAAGLADKLIFRTGELADLWRIQALFDLDGENNLPSFFSTLILLVSSLFLFLIADLNRHKPRGGYGYWLALAIWFLYMAYDEAFSVHELLNGPIREILHMQIFGFFYFAWVVPGIIFIAVFILVYFRFWKDLPVRTRREILLAAILYILGAVGFDMLGGRYVEFHVSTNLTYILLSTIEESLEMAGIIVFIWGLLHHLEDQFPQVSLRFLDLAQKAGRKDS